MIQQILVVRGVGKTGQKAYTEVAEDTEFTEKRNPRPR